MKFLRTTFYRTPPNDCFCCSSLSKAIFVSLVCWKNFTLKLTFVIVQILKLHKLQKIYMMDWLTIRYTQRLIPLCVIWNIRYISRGYWNTYFLCGKKKIERFTYACIVLLYCITNLTDKVVNNKSSTLKSMCLL